MPKDWITWWTEATFRHSNVPYWTGSGGITPPLGNTGSPSALTCNNGSVAGPQPVFYGALLAAMAGNDAGLALYASAGFTRVGVFHEQGQLDGRWVDVVIMEKILG